MDWPRLDPTPLWQMSAINSVVALGLTGIAFLQPSPSFTFILVAASALQTFTSIDPQATTSPPANAVSKNS